MHLVYFFCTKPDHNKPEEKFSNALVNAIRQWVYIYSGRKHICCLWTFLQTYSGLKYLCLAKYGKLQHHCVNRKIWPQLFFLQKKQHICCCRMQFPGDKSWTNAIMFAKSGKMSENCLGITLKYDLKPRGRLKIDESFVWMTDHAGLRSTLLSQGEWDKRRRRKKKWDNAARFQIPARYRLLISHQRSSKKIHAWKKP